MFYAVWYSYEPKRINKGISLWQGSSLVNPDFELIDTIPFNSKLTCNKLFQLRVNDYLYFFPRPHNFDLWHFDLFVYNDKLYMVSCEENKGHVMLSVSEDYKTFRTFQKPLIQNNCMDNFVHYRQYYYKPTAFVKNDSLYLFYTTRDNIDQNLNTLNLTKESMSVFY